MPPVTAPAEGTRRCGFVALIGAPNVGKSTLLNVLVGSKVSIVSPRVQTTRSRVIGIALVGAAQIIFVDTPGIFAPRRRLERAMVGVAWLGARNADIITLLVDARQGLDGATQGIMAALPGLAQPVIGVINKIDLVPRSSLLALAAALNAALALERTFMISALTGDGVAEVSAYLAARVPAGPWLYPGDQIADVPLRQLAAEIVREKLFLQLRHELPYAAAVEPETWNEQADGSVRIGVTVLVRRESQRAILLGKGGQRIKAIGLAARLEIERLLERRVHLFLHVRVRPDWPNDPERYREMGLEFPRDDG
ncbi:MAG: GTPase Era [Alphaproteobacteria bacterium]|nr:GTPase Era [Alphaproteobacteria bacterium]